MNREIVIHQAIPAATAAVAMLIAPNTASARRRLAALAPGFAAVGRLRRLAGRRRIVARLRRRIRLRRNGNRHPDVADRLRAAAGWDVLAACLRVGLPMPHALDAAAAELPASGAAALSRVAELLRLGAEPERAWEPAFARPELVRLARRARRAADSGAAVADVATTIAAELREELRNAAEAGAQRAGVLIAAPLGLCFLPAFLCLGIAPIVVGLVARLIAGP